MTNEPMETTVLEPVKSCVDCAVKACRKGEADKYPAFCLTKNMDPALLEEAIDAYSEEENHKVMEAASAAEAKFRSKMTRVEETIEFAKRMGAKKNRYRYLHGAVGRSKNLHQNSAQTRL